jgi:hypothetical protein
MQCPNCGTINPPNTAFCVHCRNQIVFFQAPPQFIANPFLQQQNQIEPNTQTSKWFSILLYFLTGLTLFWFTLDYLDLDFDDLFGTDTDMTVYGILSLVISITYSTILIAFIRKTESQKIRVALIIFLILYLIITIRQLHFYFTYEPLSFTNF